MRVTCKHCGGPHPAFECRKKSGSPKGSVAAQSADAQYYAATSRTLSTAARKDVLRVAPKLADGSPDQQAGTQALPVDTNTSVESREIGNRPARRTDEATSDNPSENSGKFDKKAWMREYMREYMRKRRAK